MNGDDILVREAQEAHQEAWERGYRVGLEMLERSNDLSPPYAIPYRNYQYYLGVAQAISNHGRFVSGMNFGKGNDPQRKAGKA